MLTAYLNIYLIFIIVSALAAGISVIKLKTNPLILFAGWLILAVILPALLGYFHFSYVGALPEVTVPDLSGLPMEAAERQLKDLKLGFHSAGSISETIFPAGNVVSQRPEAGSKVKVGRRINLILSSRAEPTREAITSEAEVEIW